MRKLVLSLFIVVSAAFISWSCDTETGPTAARRRHAVTPTTTGTATPTKTSTTLFTSTFTDTSTMTETPTDTFTQTSTETPTATETYTVTSTPSFTDTPSTTPTPTITLTPTVTFTKTITPTPTNSPTTTSTPTVTSSPTACPDQVGKLTVGPYTGSIYMTIYWLKVPVSTTVTVSHLHARVVTTNSDSGAMAVYTDNSGQPGTELENSYPFQALVTGVNDFPITSTTLTGGSTYWLAVQTLASGVISWDGYTDTTPGTGWLLAGTTFPSTLSGGTSSSTNMDIFADNCPQ